MNLKKTGLENLFLSGKYDKKTSRQFIVTDISHIGYGNVFINGIDSKIHYIRPFIPKQGISEDILKDTNGEYFIKPFSIVELDFIRPCPKNPHTENYIINPCFKPILKRNLQNNEIKFLLETIDDGYITKIFGTNIVKGNSTYKNEGCRSVGTVKIKNIQEIKYKKENMQPFRINFSDYQKTYYDIPITDLAYQKFYENNINDGINPNKLNKELKYFLNNNQLYFQIGLGPESFNIHYLYIMGIYSFPFDYKVNDYGENFEG